MWWWEDRGNGCGLYTTLPHLLPPPLTVVDPPAMPTFLITVVKLYMVKPVSLVLNLPVIPVFAWYQSYVQSVSQLISSQLSLSISLCILFVLLLK